jgi:regulator of CtrA degradation
MYNEKTGNIFIDKMYDDVYAMLLETRSYMAYIAPIIKKNLAAEERLFVTFQSTRLTSRLLEMMAWLMAQKAIHNGELTTDDARAQGFCISNDTVCAYHDDEDAEVLPQGLKSLLTRSAQLYSRIARLDAASMAA